MKKAYKGELLGIPVKLDNFFLYVSLDLKIKLLRCTEYLLMQCEWAQDHPH